MKWLITGGCGFIGSLLARRLMAEGGHQLRIVDNFSVGTPAALEGLSHEVVEAFPEQWSDTIHIVQDDILNAEGALSHVKGADVIVHLAANTGVAPSVENPRMDCETNVLGTFNYLEAARHGGVSRFVFASSGAPAGIVEPPIHEELAPHPVSPYGASKLAGEGYCSAYFHSYGIQTVALRFGNVYGISSAHKSSVVARFCTALVLGQPLTIYGDGTQTRDFISSDDLLDAIVLAATREGVGGETFQIATSRETTVNEIAEMLIDIARSHGFEIPPVRHEGRRPGDVMRNYSDTTKARTMLGWEPKVPLREGLEKVFLWFAAAAREGRLQPS